MRLKKPRIAPLPVEAFDSEIRDRFADGRGGHPRVGPSRFGRT